MRASISAIQGCMVATTYLQASTEHLEHHIGTITSLISDGIMEQYEYVFIIIEY